MRNEVLDKGMKYSRRGFLSSLAAGFSLLSLKAFPFAKDDTSAPIKVGMQAEKTGGLASYGYWHIKSAKAACQKINSEGGIDGRDIELIIADTQTNPSVGSRKIKKMVLQDRVHFVLGSQHSGVCVASLPVSRDYRTLYFPIGEATEITGEGAHPFLFRLNYSVRAHAQSGYRWALENLGKDWTFIYADYAWGQSNLKEWGEKVKGGGGNIIDSIPIPQGTHDFIPYLSRVDQERTEALFIVLFGQDALSCLKQSCELGLDEKMERFGETGSTEALDVGIPQAEGVWCISNYPRRLEDVPDDLRQYDENFRQKVGVDPEGRDISDSKNIIAGSHYWVHWENLHLLKAGIERCGWKSKNDNLELIKALEDSEQVASFAHPQGDKFIRASDHQGFHDQYMMQVVNGKLRTKVRFDKKEGLYPPIVNLSKEGGK